MNATIEKRDSIRYYFCTVCAIAHKIAKIRRLMKSIKYPENQDDKKEWLDICSAIVADLGDVEHGDFTQYMEKKLDDPMSRISSPSSPLQKTILDKMRAIEKIYVSNLDDIKYRLNKMKKMEPGYKFYEHQLNCPIDNIYDRERAYKGIVIHSEDCNDEMLQFILDDSQYHIVGQTTKWESAVCCVKYPAYVVILRRDRW